MSVQIRNNSLDVYLVIVATASIDGSHYVAVQVSESVKPQ